MIPTLIDFLYDKSVFERAARFAIFLIAELAKSGAFGEIGSTMWWVLIPIQASALLVKAGDRNQRPDEIREIAKGSSP